MRNGKRIIHTVLWALSLIVVGMFAHAQTPGQRGTDSGIISGSDIGFRIERPGKDVVGGTWMVRINGKWMPTEPVEKLKF